MGDSKSSEPRPRPSGSPPPQDAAPAAAGSGTSGRVVHDERGNAVWDWVKDTTRIAIDSTSRLLKKLETPELKMEEAKDEELRVESERDSGGGYDPYQKRTPRNTGGGGYDPYQKAVTRKPGRKP
jgi:hypothetical protein